MTTAQDVKKLEKKVKNIQEDIAQSVEEAANGNGYHLPTKEEIQQMAREAGGQVKEFVSGQQDKVREATRSYKGTVMKHPFKSTAIAFAAGAVVTALLKRK